MKTLLQAEQGLAQRINFWNAALVALLVLGICFRFVALDHKIYWHDEMYTSMRAAGFTRSTIDEAIFQNRFVSVAELQQFQQIKPNSSIVDTVQSLSQEDPQHPPLYFVMARYWMQAFGSSMFASRLLPALLSLISLPLMYLLAMELFAVPATALLATTLFSLSPFEILFAQTARQYSLLTAMMIGSSWLLLRAMRRKLGERWMHYGLSVALGFYTHPFFALTLIAQGVYVASLTWFDLAPTQKPLLARLGIWLRDRRLWYFGLAVLGALMLYAPWIWVLFNQQNRASATTDWTRVAVGHVYLAKLWLLSFTALWFDLDFGFNNPLTYLARLPFLLLIGVAFYRLLRQPRRVWLFLYTAAWVPFLLLALPDLVLGGKRSAVSRYLISCFPAVHLAVAHLFSSKLLGANENSASAAKPVSRLWPALLVLTFGASILSCSISAAAETWWNKDLSYLNAEVINQVNQATATSEQTGAARPVLLADMGDDYTNMGDLVAMSYSLRPETNLFLVGAQPNFAPVAQTKDLLVFRASKPLKAAIAQQGWQLAPINEPARLWRIVR
jgi:uncharacterized membrane protein